MRARCTTVSESINWVLADDETPDDEITVLLFVPDASESVWPGYIEDGEWYWSMGRPVQETVIAWAAIPSGPPKLELEVEE